MKVSHHHSFKGLGQNTSSLAARRSGTGYTKKFAGKS
jgi:hypothetical protein